MMPTAGFIVYLSLLSVLPVFAVAAVISEWSRYKRLELDGYGYWLQQMLHWTAVFIAIRRVFELRAKSG